MIRTLAALSLLFAATAAAAQRAAPAPRVSPQQQQRLAALGAELGRCHRAAAVRLARSRLTPPQIADRAMAECAPREAAIRQALGRAIGAGRAQNVLQAQRGHWRRTIVTIVQQSRFTR
ncbi:MAG: hypothetical protein QOG13_524 [Sphingomonadales bacterium]|jgi:hypothetical protein|nr:hypothetical protein [Sphingomonadales bacterium]